MDPNQDQKKNNINDYINNLYSGIQNARMIGQLGRGGALGKTGAGAAANVGKLAPILANPVSLAIIGIVSVTIITVFVLGGQSSTTEIPKTTPGPTPNALACKSINENPLDCLLKDFNVEASGFTDNELRDIYKAFSLVNSYPLYKSIWDKGEKKLSLIKRAPFHAETVNTCTAEAINETETMYLWKIDGCSFYGGFAYLIVHEGGHILSGRDDSLYKSFDSQVLSQKDGEGCYKFYKPQLNKPGGFYLNTYIGPGALVNEENFAEGIADYVLYETWRPNLNGVTYSLSDFPNQCPNTYRWFREKVFGQ